MTRYLAFPFRGAALALVASFTLGLVIASKAGLLGIPLAALLLSWFFKYCFVLLDTIVAGAEEPPVLSIEMVNPISEQRPLAQALLIIAGALLVFAVWKSAGLPLALFIGALLILLLPASIAALGVSGNVFRAAWPPALFGFIHTIGRSYLVLNGATLGSVALLYFMLIAGAPSWMLTAITQLLFLITFALVGGTVYEHRHALGVDTRSTRERLEERDSREHESERHHMLDHAYMKFRVSKPQEGWADLQAWLKLHGHSDDPGDKLLLEHRAILTAASDWEDVRPADKLADDLIALFLARRETGRALDVCEERMTSNPKYRPTDPTHAVRLAELATAAGKRALRRQMDAAP